MGETASQLSPRPINPSDSGKRSAQALAMEAGWSRRERLEAQPDSAGRRQRPTPHASRPSPFSSALVTSPLSRGSAARPKSVRSTRTIGEGGKAQGHRQQRPQSIRRHVLGLREPARRPPRRQVRGRRLRQAGQDQGGWPHADRHRQAKEHRRARGQEVPRATKRMRVWSRPRRRRPAARRRPRQRRRRLFERRRARPPRPP
jgi:hypothetical protein